MSIRIGIGPGAMEVMPVERYWAWVDLCEQSGVDSIWHSDQVLRPGQEPMAMLAALAARTTRLRFGTNALVLPHRDPLDVARQCATVDWLAPGRLIPVVGVGNDADPAWAATSRNPQGRGGRSNEMIALIRKLLTEDSVTFSGEHYHYENAKLTPRPAKAIPIWIGGQSPAAIRRTANLGDGWLGSFLAPEPAGEVVAQIKSALEQNGRTIDADHYGMVVPYRLGSSDDSSVERFHRRIRAGSAPALATGTAEQVTDLFRRYVSAGISKFVAIPLASDADGLIDQTQRLAGEILPRIEDRVASA